MPIYLMNFELNEWLEDNRESMLTKMAYNIVASMTLLSYYISSFSKPVVIPNLAPPNKQSYCSHCRNWKPERTHHCSICQVCVPKMDHHCPWVGNCIGYHNLKAFFLSIVY